MESSERIRKQQKELIQLLQYTQAAGANGAISSMSNLVEYENNVHLDTFQNPTSSTVTNKQDQVTTTQNISKPAQHEYSKWKQPDTSNIYLTVTKPSQHENRGKSLQDTYKITSLPMDSVSDHRLTDHFMVPADPSVHRDAVTSTNHSSSPGSTRTGKSRRTSVKKSEGKLLYPSHATVGSDPKERSYMRPTKSSSIDRPEKHAGLAGAGRGAHASHHSHNRPSSAPSVRAV